MSEFAELVAKLQKSTGADLAVLLSAGPPPRRLSLLQPKDVALTLRELEALDIELPDGLIPLWGLDDDEMLALCTRGPMIGMVARIDSEDLDLAPIFRNPTSLHRAYEGLDSEGCPKLDFPIAIDQQVDGAERQRYLDIVAELEAELGECDKVEYEEYWRHLAITTLVLSPPGETERLRRFLADDDPWVKETACIVAGLQRDEGTLDALVGAATEHEDNGTIAAIGALGAMGSTAAREALIAASVRIPATYALHVAGALAKLGCEVRRSSADQRVFEYRVDGSPWAPVGVRT